MDVRRHDQLSALTGTDPYRDTRKTGTLSVFSMFFATAFCMPSITTTPSLTDGGVADSLPFPGTVAGEAGLGASAAAGANA